MTGPFDISMLLDDPDWRREMEKTPAGRQKLRQLDAKRNLDEIEANAKASTKGYSPEELRRLEGFRASQGELSKNLESFAETGRPRSEATAGNLYAGAGDEFIRGAGAGALSAVPNLAQSLVLGPINRVTGGAASGASDYVEQYNAFLAEKLGLHSGFATGAGEFAGNVAGGLPVMGPIARAAARPVAAAVGTVAPRAADVIRASAGLGTKAFDVAPGRLAQGAANVVSGLPFQALQQVGMENATLADRAKAAALGTAQDFGFGAIFSQRPGTLMHPSVEAVAQLEKDVQGLPEVKDDLRAQALEKFAKNKAATQEKQAHSEARKLWEREARINAQKAFFTAEGTKKPWGSLGKDEQKKWVDQWKQANPFVEPTPAAAGVAEAVPASTAPEAVVGASAPAEVKIPETGMPVGTVLQQADGGTVKKISANLWRSGEGFEFTDSQVAGRLAEFKPVPEPIAGVERTAQELQDIGQMGGAIVDNMYDAMYAKYKAGETKEAGQPSVYLQVASRIAPDGSLAPEVFRSLVGEVDVIKGRYSGAEYQAKLKDLVESRKAVLAPESARDTNLNNSQAGPGVVAPNTITSYRGYMTHEGEGQGMATEGAGTYVADSPEVASMFAMDGYVTKVVHKTPSKAIHVGEDELYALKGSKEIDQPENPGDSDWLKANKRAAKKATRYEGYIQTHEGEFGPELTRQLRSMGYDAVRVSGKEGSWWVLLDDKLKLNEQKATWKELGVRHNDPTEAAFWEKVDKAVAKETVGSPPSVRRLLKEKYGKDTPVLSDAEYEALPDALLAEYRKREPFQIYDEEGNHLGVGTVEEELANRAARRREDARQANLIDNPRSWWNSLKPGEEREAWLRHAGWEPNTGSRVAAPDARYDALPQKALEAARRAHEAYLRGETPSPATKAEPPKLEVVKPDKLPTKPETVNAANGTTFTYDWSLARRPKKLSDEDLPRYLAETQRRVDVTQSETVRSEYLHAVEKMKEELKDRFLERGPQAQSPGMVGGAALGYLGGVMTVDEDDPNRSQKIIAAAVLGGIGGHYAQKFSQRKALQHETAPRQLLTNKVPTVERLGEGRTPKPIITKLREVYKGTVRSINPLERVVGNLAEYDPERAAAVRRNAALFGNWISGTEQALTDRLVYRDVRTRIKNAAGNWVDNPGYGQAITITKDDGSEILTPKQILALAKGDIDGLGEVAVAARVLERESMGITKHPMDPMEANRVFHSAPAHMVQAAKELREFHYGIAKMLHMNGRVSDAGLAAMKTQEWYTPFYYRTETGQVRSMDPYNLTSVGVGDPLKAAKKGAKYPVVNPFEQTLVLTPRFLKAIEWGQLTQSIVDFGRSIGDDDVRKAFIRRVGQNELTPAQRAVLKKADDDARAVAATLGIKPEDVDGLVTMIHADDPQWSGGTFTNWEQGIRVTYRVNEEVFSSMKSLLPMERDLLTNMFAKTARSLSMGVVNSPVFVANQFFKDSFEAATLSRYGFNPFTDSVRALKHIYTRSDEYRQLLDLGGPGTVQSLKYLDPAKALTSIRAEGGSALADFWQNIKELHPIEAYKTMVLPFAEAARVGEYLKALDHGATPIEAVYAAWNVLGNTRVQGAAPLLRKIEAMTPFLRASVSAMDEMFSRAGAGRRTFNRQGQELSRGQAFMGWAVRGFTSLVLPTLAFRAIEHLFGEDSEELRQLRNTTVGQRFWFIKPSDFIGEDQANAIGLGGIVRIPRPHAAGVLFAASTDMAWDKMVNDHPAEATAWADALVSQLWMNTVPTLGVVVAGMLTGKDVSRGPGEYRDIIAERDKNVEPAMQGRLTASMPARIVGQTMGRLPGIGSMFSPPMVDFVMRGVGGMAVEDLLRGMSQVSEYVDSGYVPAKYELPVMRQFFVNTNSTNVADVEKFYRTVDRAEGVYLAWKELSTQDPAQAVKYYTENQQWINIAPMLTSTRRDMGELRNAGVDLKQLTRDYTTPERRRELEKFFAESIKLHARLANKVVGQLMGGQ